MKKVYIAFKDIKVFTQTLYYISGLAYNKQDKHIQENNPNLRTLEQLTPSPL